jgi:hypothetical protein
MARVVSFSEEGETECTSEMARGQFSIFGAIEEMFAGYFRGSVRGKNFDEDIRASRMEGGSCAGGRRDKEKVGRAGKVDCPQGVHRKCRKRDVGR